MKAVVYEAYGPPDVLHLADVPKPAPRPDEIVIKVYATTVSAGDARMRALNVPGPIWERLAARVYLGIRRPKRQILGMQLAGEVEATGENVRRFVVGDQVFASTGLEFGGYAEYRCLAEKSVTAVKPATMSYEEAATVPTPGIGALRVLRQANIQPGQNVLVYGASGSVGTFAVQLARVFGAEVTAVCSGANSELVKSLGASEVIDYTRTDYAASGARYDCIFDAVGKIPKAERQKALAPAGTFVSITQQDGERLEDLVYLRDLIEAGELRTVIDRRYPLAEAAEAHRYVDTGHKKGHVVLIVRPEERAQTQTE